MRNLILGLIVCVATAGCSAMGEASPPSAPELTVLPTETPFVRVVAGHVSGLVPESWSARPLDDSPRQGFLASPDPSAWRSIGVGTTGIAASWIDATQVGLSRDAYYLAARGPLLAAFVTTPGCRALREVVVVDHAPSYSGGAWTSPGDYIAKAEGVCRTDGAPRVRWSYFVAAPGYGPVTELGIPSSGLYVATAVTRDSARADARLERLLSTVRFGDAGLGDLIRAARMRTP